MRATSLKIHDLPYFEDSSRLFHTIAGRPWAVFLDSGHPYAPQGRFDILTSDPRITLTTRGKLTEIRDQGGVRLSRDDPFSLVETVLGPKLEGVDTDLPFCGGAVGYWGYDLCRRIERLPSLAEDIEGLPEMAIGIYDWALVVDHREKRSRLLGRPGKKKTWDDLARCFSQPGPPLPGPAFRVVGEVRPNMTRSEYASALRRIKRYIRDGDCYQVNFAQRFSVPATGNPLQLYKGLRRFNPAPFGAFLNTPYGQILSSSPERFLRVWGDQVETRPIKGTLARATDPAQDRARIDALRHSAKDRAENVMIVDLLRNDLGKTCAFGSIQVSELFAVESFARVHHLVSTVRGRLAQGQGALSLLRGCFPGGSITGAPKLRAMQIIEELEPQRRGVYCGAIGYVGFDGSMDTNLAIRTLVHSHDLTRFWAGGGIVADSDAQAEYQETLDKAAAILDLLQAIKAGTGR